jgi:hypothetical protein
MNDRNCTVEQQLRDQIERVIEDAADRVHDSTQWWSREDGVRPIDKLGDAIVAAARQYHAKMRELEHKTEGAS